ncbi:MAG: peptidase M20 [Euryarchaeota archaeon]|nr:peptidase M20 [Euryarchaeota archaeon]|tara:strand:+ start:4047 stop:5459 length:1413 start_codon:yes stop_codon:yes gene_type:complete
MPVDLDSMAENADRIWEESILPSLSEFIEIHALSPMFEPNWDELGELQATLDLFCSWLDNQGLQGMSYNVHRIANHSPVLLVTIEGTGSGEVLFYSHLDKQPSRPHLWSEGLHPLKAVRREPFLYGRGSVDDGYGGYLCVTAIRLLQEAGIPHPKATFLIETCEESGSYDLPPYLDELTEDLGNPDLVVVLDSGGPSYEHIWVTEALRGLVAGNLSVRVSHEGVHSGMSGGAIPSSFRIQRMLLDRIENSQTGEVLIPEMHVEISDNIIQQATALAEVLGDELWSSLPTVETLESQSKDASEMLLDINWRPALSVIGADGIPSVQSAGNVLRTNTDLKISFRIPPGVNAEEVQDVVKQILEENPPYGAEVTYNPTEPADGFHAPPLHEGIASALESTSLHLTGKPPMSTWIGGTIPFMAMIQNKYPNACFLCTGSSGPGNNAHGPDEKLHIPHSKRVNVALAAAIAALCE